MHRPFQNDKNFFVVLSRNCQHEASFSSHDEENIRQLVKIDGLMRANTLLCVSFFSCSPNNNLNNSLQKTQQQPFE